MSKAEEILLFDALFAILLFTYGVGTGSVTLAGFQTVQTPTLAPLPKTQTQNCQNTDLGCIASNAAVATAYIGWAIVNLPVLIIFFAVLVISFGNIVLQVTFSPAFTSNGVPFLGLFFTALQLYIIWEVIRTIRGSSVGV